MAETLCQKRALEAFRLDPEKWGGKYYLMSCSVLFFFFLSKQPLACTEIVSIHVRFY